MVFLLHLLYTKNTFIFIKVLYVNIKVKQASSCDDDVTNKISHIFPSTINNQREVDDDVNAWQPFVTLPSNLQKSNSSLMGFPADNSPLLAKISESATRNSAFTCVMPSRKKSICFIQYLFY